MFIPLRLATEQGSDVSHPPSQTGGVLSQSLTRLAVRHSNACICDTHRMQQDPVDYLLLWICRARHPDSSCSSGLVQMVAAELLPSLGNACAEPPFPCHVELTVAAAGLGSTLGSYRVSSLAGWLFTDRAHHGHTLLLLQPLLLLLTFRVKWCCCCLHACGWLDPMINLNAEVCCITRTCT